MVLTGLAGCRNSGSGHDHAMARRLFEKSASLILLYTDSLRNVADSASLKRMNEDFQDKITKINFEFPPETDLDLSQQENDSLVNLLDSLVAVRNEKIKRLILANPSDSLHVDSISPVKRAGVVKNTQSDTTSISQSRQLNRSL